MLNTGVVLALLASSPSPAAAVSAAGLKAKLPADAPSEIHYDAPKPDSLRAEDEVIGALKLNLAPDAVTITPVADAFR